MAGVVDRSGAPLSDAQAAEALPADTSRLVLARCALTSLPPSLPGGWRALTLLDVGGNALTLLPSALGELATLETLNAADNLLTSLPAELCLLSRLRLLGLRGNRLEALPETLGSLRALESLFLTDNRLRALPASIGECVALRKVQAASNLLASLPASLWSLPLLEMLRVPCNQLPREALAGVEASPSLCWLSLAGNPGWPAPPPARAVPQLAPSDYAAGSDALGPAGASGGVFAASWRGEAVALKLFRTSSLSPDGHPEDEVACALALPAGCASLVSCIGLQRAPLAMLMTRVSGAPLGGRPGPVPLLRSRYAEGARFAPQQALRTARDVAHALAACHAAGIAHGDVYAHNIVVEAATGAATLVDLGAAFSYAGAGGFERVEVRAFGILLRELAERVEGSASVAASLHQLAGECLAEPSLRPSFAAIALRLD